MKHLMTFMSIALISVACSTPKHKPVDLQATKSTCALYERLFELQKKGVMLAHQDDIAYGFQRYEPGFSDVYDMTGDYPAVVGWELGHIELAHEYSLDSVYFDDMRRGIADIDRRGGLSTISWHGDNILSGGSTWDTSRPEIVSSILPGGSHHEAYLVHLDRLADFLLSLKNDEGELIPVVLRLYHEQNRGWFWWNLGHAGAEQYKALYRMAVSHLRDVKGVHNVLYAFSPNDVVDIEEYMASYPGNDYVDIVGFDFYYFGNDENARTNYMNIMRTNLQIVEKVAAENGKLPIMAETGYEGVPAADYFTRTISPLLEESNVAWILFWRNAWDPDLSGHFYLPYKGHSAEEDFKDFVASDRILMNKDIQ